jgi:hypothetical protein
VASLAIGGVCPGLARLAGWLPMAEPETPLLAVR